MKHPTCTICQLVYDDEARAPLMLACGHSFCKACLAQLFAASKDHTLPCPRCRHTSAVGNSVEALRKNFGVLALLGGAPVEDGGAGGGTDSDSGDELADVASNPYSAGSRGNTPQASPSWPPACNGMLLDVAVHSLRLLRLLGQGPRPDQDVWSGILTGPGGCRHKVAVKRVSCAGAMELEWVQAKVEGLRRAAMWCQNVCTVHGACEKDGKLCIIMDKHITSVKSVMQQSGGRLTLEQILRYGADVSRGVAELHAAGILCMALKPSNILLDKRGRAVISDYGLPEILRKVECKRGRDRLHLPSQHCRECLGLTPNYIAPEVWEPFRKSSLNLFTEEVVSMGMESDAWSFGCTFVEMCTGTAPWHGTTVSEMLKAVVKAKRQPPQYTGLGKGGMPRELWKMIGECFHHRPSKRPTFHAMLTVFLRHLKELPFSPPPSPENLSKFQDGPGLEPSPASTLDYDPNVGSELHRLVAEGQTAAVRDLIAKARAGELDTSTVGSLLETRNADGQTPLHVAAMRGYDDILRPLLEQVEADVEGLDKDGDTPIFCAISSGSIECLQALIERGANVNGRLKDGLGPSVAHVCAFHGHPDCMQELVKAGADPNAVDDEGESVLHRAVAKRHTECALAILESGGCPSMATVNPKGLTPLHLCIASANITVVKQWLELASKDQLEAALEIPSSVGSPLCMAAALKKFRPKARELVKVLLSAGAQPEAKDVQRGQTALHCAASSNDPLMVQVILDAGVEVDITDSLSNTPLHVALARGSKECVGHLLQRGANCNLQDDDGDTALHIAADMAKMVRENIDWLALMLQRPDAAVNAKNNSGKTMKELLETLPREWVSEELEDALVAHQIELVPPSLSPGDWVTFKRTIEVPENGWQGATKGSVGFVQKVVTAADIIVAFCTGEAKVKSSEVRKIVSFECGQHVKVKDSVVQPRYSLEGQARDNVGTVLCVDDDGVLRIGFPGISRGRKADPADMERVEIFKVGDWVRVRPSLVHAKHGLGNVMPGSIGVVYSIRPDHSILLDLNYLQEPWHCEPEEVEHVTPFQASVGDRVCVRRAVAEPRYAWGWETHHSVGTVSEVGGDGLLSIDIPPRPLLWQADPADMEKLEDFAVGDWVHIKPSVPSPKYGWEDVTRSSIGVVHYLDEDGDVGIGVCGRTRPFSCSVTDLEKVAAFLVGEEVHILSSVMEPCLGWAGETSASKGKIASIDMDGTLNVRVEGRASMWRLSPGDAERLSGYLVGDWVRLRDRGTGVRPRYNWHGAGPHSTAVVHSISDAGVLDLAGTFRQGRWQAHCSDVEKVEALRVGHHVRLRRDLDSPRWGWRGAHAGSRGVVIGVHADGELRLALAGVAAPWRADPADVEREEVFEVGEWVKVRNGPVEPVYGWRGVKPGSIGIVQGLISMGLPASESAGAAAAASAGSGNAEGGAVAEEEEQVMQVGFCGVQEKLLALPEELERVTPLAVGQAVRVRPSVVAPRFGWSGHSPGSVGIVAVVDADGLLRVNSAVGGGGNAASKSWMLDPAEVEPVDAAAAAPRVGDWVRVSPSVPTPSHQWGDVTHASIGVVHRVGGEGDIWLAFCFLERLWMCRPGEVERLAPFRIGDAVRIKRSVAMPRWGWGIETRRSRGVVTGVDADGKVRIRFHRRDGRPWVGDPADIELDDAEPKPHPEPVQLTSSANR
eukprot:SM000043S15828  [mRNA]  locus=s43:431291:439771:+ [translate_table: standard]